MTQVKILHRVKALKFATKPGGCCVQTYYLSNASVLHPTHPSLETCFYLTLGIHVSNLQRILGGNGTFVFRFR